MTENNYYWRHKGGELVALFSMSVGKQNLLVPYTVPELERIAGSLQPDEAKEGIFPHQAQEALDSMEDFRTSECLEIAAQ